MTKADEDQNAFVAGANAFNLPAALDVPPKSLPNVTQKSSAMMGEKKACELLPCSGA